MLVRECSVANRIGSSASGRRRRVGPIQPSDRSGYAHAVATTNSRTTASVCVFGRVLGKHINISSTIALLILWYNEGKWQALLWGMFGSTRTESCSEDICGARFFQLICIRESRLPPFFAAL